ncbi:MAG: hypothetical protein QXY50_00835 [Candidatus Caldarchaeum sp.]
MLHPLPLVSYGCEQVVQRLGPSEAEYVSVSPAVALCEEEVFVGMVQPDACGDV